MASALSSERRSHSGLNRARGWKPGSLIKIIREITLDKSIYTAEHDEHRTADLQHHIKSKLNNLTPEALAEIYQVCCEIDALQPTSTKAVAQYRVVEPMQIHRLAQQHAEIQRSAPELSTITRAESSNEECEDGRGDYGNPKVIVHIDNQDEVIRFLETRFNMLQNLATKAVARGWIKAICPKKQAKFPYKGRGCPRADPKGSLAIPPFWPNPSLCRHKEPDHIRKTERTQLLLHLLRLNWTEQDWLDCNGYVFEVPRKIRDHDWIGFLKDAFPIGILADMPDSTPEKTAVRSSYLGQIYEVAEDEQMMRRGIGPANPKRTYRTRAGWVSAGPLAVEPTSQSDRPDTRDQSDSPTLKASTEVHPELLSMSDAVSPPPQGRSDEPRLATSYTVDDLNSVTMTEHSGTKYDYAPESKFVPQDERMVGYLAAPPVDGIAGMDYPYQQPQHLNQQFQPLYQQSYYLDPAVSWYEMTNPDIIQRNQLSYCQQSEAIANQAWNDCLPGNFS